MNRCSRKWASRGECSQWSWAKVGWARNCCDRVSPQLPRTERGHSGMDSTLSKLGILAFVQPKGWHLKSGE
ncbi:MAG TPA: hypothetical protein EYQ25_11350 [Planctomycetes bacterium]|nr:hypothetical protein [Planctomycetota bacterium]HIL38136.1 hypothetical protein [Planctomycetota bacterium]